MRLNAKFMPYLIQEKQYFTIIYNYQQINDIIKIKETQILRCINLVINYILSSRNIKHQIPGKSSRSRIVMGKI